MTLYEIILILTEIILTDIKKNTDLTDIREMDINWNNIKSN